MKLQMCRSDHSQKSMESSIYICDVAASSKEQLLSIQDITTSIEKTARFGEELRVTESI
ncbi:hypothetical protein [Metabacillus litoralis]|uniref:hypothetical protein n=1 Tax=Metabacillus litoralis TaxID=152268 RepID=UPI00203EDC6D|nr:hypothetical protein [Metabacillus litoralis]MCM3163624.1 hypothetical protein [Metabacillus litoralis]